MSRDFLDLAASFERTAAGLPRAQEAGVRNAALYMTTVIRASIVAAAGGDNYLSGGRGKRGSYVGAGFKMHGKGTVFPYAIISGRGKLWLLEEDTSPHTIYPRGYQYTRDKRGRAKRRSSKTALKFSNGTFAGYADHPGTTGKHPFRRGVQASQHNALPIIQQQIRKSIRVNYF